MKKGIFKNKPVLITIIALVVLAVLLVATSGPRTASWFESFMGGIFAPVNGLAVRVSTSISGFFQDIFNTTDADLENARLKSELALYQQTQLELEELKLENERLRDLLGYAGEFGEYEYVTARITGRSTNVWFEVFTVNAGRNQGIDVDMPVICSDGLVGRVTEVGASWCKITAIIDSGVTVPVMVERTRDNCMVRGILDTSAYDREMELYYLPTDRTDIVPGDIIITSGIGGIYPKGIRIGTVAEVMTGEHADGVRAIILPAVDFLHLEEILIITGQTVDGGQDG